MPDKTYTIKGTVVSRSTRKGIGGLRVEAWDKDLIADDLVGSAVTDAEGAFAISFDASYFRELFLDRTPDLYFRIFSGDDLILSTEESTLWNVQRPDEPITLTIDWMSFTVSGRVSRSDGSPLAGLTVTAFDCDMRHEQPLGEAKTDAQGAYTITYRRSQFRRADKAQADLRIRVTDEDGIAVAASEIVFNAEPAQTIDLTLHQYRGPSEWNRYVKDLELLIEDVPLSGLMDEDIRFLTGETGIAAEHLRYLRLDAQWSEQYDVEESVFYGLLRQGLSSNLRTLLAEKPARWQRALEAASAQHLIRAHLEDNLDAVIARLEEVAVMLAFEPDDEDAAPPLGLVLRTAPDLSEDQQQQFIRFALRDDGGDDFWARLREEPGFDANDGTLETFRFTVETGALLSGHMPTLAVFQERRQQQGGITQRDFLASFSRSDLQEITQVTFENNPPLGFEDAGAFAEDIAYRVEQVFPTSVVKYRTAANSAFNDDTQYFFAANVSANDPEHAFDLIHTAVDDFLDNGADLGEVEDVDGLRLNLKQMQRVARIVPRRGFFDTMQHLTDNGFTSASSIVARGRPVFMETMTPLIGDAVAGETYHNAHARADAVLVLQQHLRDYLEGPMWVLPRLPEATVDLPAWAEMFGSISGCACEHCRSVYSPAAYMADALKFLDDAPRPAGAPGLLDALFERRPDLPLILLNCANATTPLPYIDLVNELLEAAVAPETPVEWRTYQAPEPNGETRAQIERRLRAEPDPSHEHTPAYDRLATAEYPWLLPFSPDQERVWLFCQHLGVALDDVRALFDRDQDIIARDFLRISEPVWNRLTRPADGVDARGLWGLPDLALLEQAPVFMAQAALSFDELQQLTNTWFLSAEGLAEVVAETEDGDDPCDVADYRVQGLRDEDGAMDRVLNQIHRFLRLQRHLGWSIPDLDAFLAAFGHTEINNTALGNVARVQRLAAAYRRPAHGLISTISAALADLLRVTETEADLFAELLGVDALDLADRLRLLEQWRFFRASGFDLRELAYILLGWDQVPAAFTPADTDTRRFLRDLHAFIPVNEAELLAAAATEIRQAVDEFERGLGPELTPEDRQAAIEAFRVDYVDGLKRRYAEAAIIENLGRYLDLPSEIVDRLIRPVTAEDGTVIADALVGAQSTPADPALVDFVHFVQIDAGVGEPDEAEPPAYVNARLLLVRLDRLARLLRSLGIDRRVLDVVAQTRAANGFPDFNLLTLDGEPAADKYAGWRALVEARQLQRNLPAADQDLFDFIQAAAEGAYDGADLTAAEAFASLAEHTGWSAEALVALSPALGLDAAAFARAETYARLHQAMQWLRRWRIDPDTLICWGDPARPVDELAQSLKNTAHDRYPDDARWHEVLTPLSDRLREMKRDALLAYLIHTNDAFTDTDDVYAHYLIDMEMSSCMLTSRIKQANASIQLYVQRLLMNIESGVRLADADAEYWQRWQWMKNYRVWEANRKVFLYPENWIEPDLRDNKSPFFRDLENDLLQDEVTQETVERAYRTYLEKLDEVARLDARGLYQEEDRDHLHVFARTYNEPHRYYHCQRRADRVWTAWEQIDLNIEGDHLIPVVHEGRLMLFWPLFEDTKKIQRDDDGEEEAVWSVKLAWSEHVNGKWKARQVGSDKPLLTNYLARDQFTFKAMVEDGDLFIRVYEEHPPPLNPMISSIMRLRFDPCTRQLVNDPASEKRLYLNPARTRISAMGFVEQEDEPIDQLTAIDQLGSDTVGVSEEISELLREGGLGGLIVGLILAAADVRGQWDRFVRSRRPVSLLDTTPGRFTILPAHQSRQFTGLHPFFTTLEGHTYVVRPFEETVLFLGRFPFTFTRYQFELFYHPFVCAIIRAVSREGIEALSLGSADRPGEWPARQRAEENTPVFGSYGPQGFVSRPYPFEMVDFSLTGAYSLYNWELFFHIPLLVADRLSKNQRFEEAQRWFHFIFDPTDVSTHGHPAKYWRVKPFFEEAENPPTIIRDLMRRLAAGDNDLEAQVDAWRNNPFNPHLIARLRRLAYMKTVVMKYLDNLIAWADDLFARDTIETINEAAQLYILAAEILGERPVTITRPETDALDFATVRERLDDFANVLIDLETELPAEITPRTTAPDELPPNLILYFCIPSNQKLLAYWDTVADRLFKIRHCMNIEGQVRQLPLFEPPIDPALLVRATAAGLDLRQALSQIGAVGLPFYRYSYMYQKALELCNDVRSLGTALLSALEKKDAEELSLLRSRHEGALLAQVQFIKKHQIEEAEETLEGLKVARQHTEQRLEYYASRDFMNAAEIASMTAQSFAHVFESIGQGFSIAAAGVHLIPQVHAQGVASGTSSGGQQVGDSLSATAQTFRFIASQFTFAANMASTIGGYQRRQDDWTFQARLAETEIKQIDRQIAAAEIRLAIAEQDLANHEQQIEQNREVEDFLRRKFTNQQLYGWMTGQLAALHFQAYRMARDLALKAERAAQHELGIDASDFGHIGFEHWDSQKKGLLAGERLHQELRRMDGAYLEQNRRDYEITRHFSLAMLNPAQLIQLRETGSCTFWIPEMLFDLDFPGQYRRRIKGVSVTIPCVTGPYTNVSARLTLEYNRIRQSIDGTTAADYPYDPSGSEGDTRFRVNVIGEQSIATSTAQSDSGLFEFNFRDERYLPFEGTGAISRWRLELPSEIRQFDYDTISDVILHMQYTARDDGEGFKDVVATHLRGALNRWLDEVGASGSGLHRIISLQQEFASSLHRFLHPPAEETVHEARLPLENRHFPFFLRGRELAIQEAHVLVKLKEKDHRAHFAGHPIQFARSPLPAPETPPAGENLNFVGDDSLWGGLPAATFGSVSGSPTGDWALRLDPGALHSDITLEIDGRRRLNPDVVEDIFLVLRYEVSPAL